MSDRLNRTLRGGARAAVGVVVAAAAAAAVVIVQTLPLPVIEREAVAVTVDATQRGGETLVCPGAFATLGADPSRPSVAVPSGSAIVTVTGEFGERRELVPAEPGGSAPQVLSAEGDGPFAAAQVQQVATDDLRGLVAASCVAPTTEQWLIGGDSTLGVSTTVMLGNPTDVAATVQLTVYDESGPVDSSRVAGVLVPAGTERIVSIGGYAPGRDRLAVRVVSTGAPVSATLSISQARTISSFSVDTVTRQLAPADELVIPGVTNLSAVTAGPNDVSHDEGFPVLVRLLAPGGEEGSATVSAMLADGGAVELGTVEFADAAVAELVTAEWPAEANAVRIESTAPVIAAVMGSADAGPDHDVAWFSPAPLIGGAEPIAAPVVVGGQLVLANPGDEPATVRIASATGSASSGGLVPDAEAVIPAGAAVAVQAPADAVLTSDRPVSAGVHAGSSANLAAYPILTPLFRLDELTVFTR